MFTAPPITSPDIYPTRVAAALLRNRVFEEVRVKIITVQGIDTNRHQERLNCAIKESFSTFCSILFLLLVSPLRVLRLLRSQQRPLDHSEMPD
jgi:hypothetical protein